MGFSLCGPCVPETAGTYNSLPIQTFTPTKVLRHALDVAIAAGNEDNVAFILKTLRFRKISLPKDLLVTAFKYEYYRVCEVLLENSFDPTYYNLLTRAAESGKYKFVELFLRYKQKYELDPNSDNGQALLRAIDISRNFLLSDDDYVKTVNILLSHGANPNINNGDALKLAAKHGHVKIVNLLCRYNVDLEQYGLAALNLAAKNAHPKIMAIILYYIYCKDPQSEIFEKLPIELKYRFEDINLIAKKHAKNEHQPRGKVRGGLFFSWKSIEEKICDQLFECANERRMDKLIGKQ